MDHVDKIHLIFLLTVPFIEHSDSWKNLSLVSHYFSWIAQRELFRDIKSLDVAEPDNAVVERLAVHPTTWRPAQSVRSLELVIDMMKFKMLDYGWYEKKAASAISNMPNLRHLEISVDHDPDSNDREPSIDFEPMVRALTHLESFTSLKIRDWGSSGILCPPALLLSAASGLHVLALSSLIGCPDEFATSLIIGAAPTLTKLSLPYSFSQESGFEPVKLVEHLTSLHFPNLRSLTMRHFPSFNFPSFAARHPNIVELDYSGPVYNPDALTRCVNVQSLTFSDDFSPEEIEGFIRGLPFPEKIIQLNIVLDQSGGDELVADVCRILPSLERLAISGWFAEEDYDHRFDEHLGPINSYSSLQMEITAPYGDVDTAFLSLKELQVYSTPLRIITLPSPPHVENLHAAVESGLTTWLFRSQNQSFEFAIDNGRAMFHKLQKDRILAWARTIQPMVAEEMRMFVKRVPAFERLRWVPYVYEGYDYDIDVIVRKGENDEIIIDGGFGRDPDSLDSEREDDFATLEYNGPWILPWIVD